MRPLIIVAVPFLLVAAAVASDDTFKGEAATDAYNDFRSACRQSELWGTEITAEESGKACIALAALAEQLRSHGYCWDDAEFVWALCR